MQYYVLDEERNPKRTNRAAYEEFMSAPGTEKRRVVNQTVFTGSDGTDKDVEISTVFLGIYHGGFTGPPVLFETMVFNPPGDEDYQVRYHTWDEAASGHVQVVEAVKKELSRKLGLQQ